MSLVSTVKSRLSSLWERYTSSTWVIAKVNAKRRHKFFRFKDGAGQWFWDSDLWVRGGLVPLDAKGIVIFESQKDAETALVGLQLANTSEEWQITVMTAAEAARKIKEQHR